MALRDLQLLYPEVNVLEEYAGGKPTPTNENYLKEAFSMDWGGMVSTILDNSCPFSHPWLNSKATFTLLVVTLAECTGVFQEGSATAGSEIWNRKMYHTLI